MSEKSNAMRSNILREFDRQIYVQGYQGTTLKSVCDALSISTGHLYYYFKKKEELYLAISKDLLFKVRKIIDSSTSLKIDKLTKTLLTNYLIFYTNIKSLQLCKISLEISNYPSLISDISDLFTKFYIDSFKEINFEVSDNLVIIALQTAHASIYTFHRLINNGNIKMNSEELYDYYFKIIFDFTNFPSDEFLKYKNKLMQILNLLDKDAIVAKIYEMDEYNYSEESM